MLAFSVARQHERDERAAAVRSRRAQRPKKENKANEIDDKALEEILNA